MMSPNNKTNFFKINILNKKENIDKKKKKKKKKNKLNAISLFSGMGGDSLGIVNAGLNLVAYAEKEKVFQETHDLNFKDCELLGDGDLLKITDEDFLKYKNKVDLIFAGFPCQAFSNAGKKKVNDPRNTMFREFARATRLIKPKYIIGENVKGLLSKKNVDGKKYIDIIVKEFEDLGYNINYKICSANKYGVPQKRDRLIILGILKENKENKNKEIEFPEEEKDNTNLLDIIKFDMKGSIKVPKEAFDMTTIPTECILKNNEDYGQEKKDKNIVKDKEDKPHPYLKLKVESRDSEWKGKVHKNLLSFGKRGSPIHAEVIDIRKPSKTIICSYNHQPRFYVPLKKEDKYYLRCILPDELKQIQGFPKNYKICGNTKQQITQIGNAVPPPLIEKIVRKLITQ